MLFRSEVVSHRADRLSGDISLAVPLPWQFIGYLLLGGLATAFVFLLFASYSRVETVAGTIEPDAGVSAIVPPRSGVVAELGVRDGDEVATGAKLATIRTEEGGPDGLSASAKIEIAIARQDAGLAAQIGAASATIAAQRAQLEAQHEGLAAEIAQLQSQIGLQSELITSAQQDLDRARTIADRGFISGRDLQVREETLLVRQQSLSQLTQEVTARRSALAEAEHRMAELAAQQRARAASLAAARAEVAQQAESVAGSRSYVLRAPVAGEITALTARIGQPANPQNPLMSIVPVESVLRAELAVPSAAIGFVEEGQSVRLAVDAFPYQQFGTVSGKVITVSSSAIARPRADGATAPVYPVTVQLESQTIDAHGREEALVPGMTLTARIVTEKQSLFQWLFEPLFAVQRR